jgi:integrase
MNKAKKSSQYFHEYFSTWIEVYKLGAVRPVTYKKYLMTLQRLRELAPNLRICEINRQRYQMLINEYAHSHERQTTMDFHKHLKSAILDAVDEGLLPSNPTRKIVIKGKPPANKKTKFLNQHELQTLLENLTLPNAPSWDWFILLVAKTGLRFSEALAITPNDFDFENHKLKISKTWLYKNVEGGFGQTKNFSSMRTLSIDPQLCIQFAKLINGLEPATPIFVNGYGRVFNSTVNDRLHNICKNAGVPKISLHSLRHTHASILIFAGVSIASVAKRLGHSSVTTTQETYLHIIQELENLDNDKIVQHLSMLM